MSHLNSRNEKVEKRFNNHNRKAGAARYLKETRNRKGRRWASRVDKKRAINFDSETIQIKPAKAPNHKPYKSLNIPNPSLAEILTKEQIEQLKKIK